MSKKSKKTHDKINRSQQSGKSSLIKKKSKEDLRQQFYLASLLVREKTKKDLEELDYISTEIIELNESFNKAIKNNKFINQKS